MIVGFTGTRKGMTDKQQQALREELLINWATELHHGDCVGADEQACNIAQTLGIDTACHPPTDRAFQAYTTGNRKMFPRKAYLVRNENIVRAAEMLIATPDSEHAKTKGSGTWATIRYAAKHKKAVTIIFPNGDTARLDNQGAASTKSQPGG